MLEDPDFFFRCLKSNPLALLSMVPKPSWKMYVRERKEAHRLTGGTTETHLLFQQKKGSEGGGETTMVKLCEFWFTEMSDKSSKLRHGKGKAAL